MRPLDDWLVMRLWEKQAAEMDVRLALPETVDRARDEGAVFEVLQVGPDVQGRVQVGDIVIINGYGNIDAVTLPNRSKCIVAQACNVAFVLEPRDLGQGDNREETGNAGD